MARRGKRSVRRKRQIFSIREKLFITFLMVVMLSCVVYLVSMLMFTGPEIKLPVEYDQKLTSGNINVVLDNTYLDLENFPIKQEQTIYIPYDLIKTYIDPYFFWDKNDRKVVITTGTEVVRIDPDELIYFINDAPLQMQTAFVVKNDVVYAPVDFVVNRYPVEISYAERFDFLVIDKRETGRLNAEVMAKKTLVYYEPDKKSAAGDTVYQGDRFIIYEEEDKYTQVRTRDGLLGYVLTKDIAQRDYIKPELPEPDPEYYPSKGVKGKVNLVWDLITKTAANSDPSKRVVRDGLKVLSPTWFSFDPSLNGEIIDIGDINYVKWAHENKYSVWAQITDNFDSDVNNAILSSTNERKRIIENILELADKYDLDGINVDFEALRLNNSANYVQFFRELYPFMKERGLVLSVDIFVPMPYSMYYNRAEVGKSVDYICVMTYDEHTEVSETSGPVASLPFVEKGISDTLNEVSKDKIIMCLPYYVRVWREETVNGVIKKTQRAYGMSYTYDLFKKSNAEFEWDAEIGSYYSEFKKNEDGVDVVYRVWLEDERSIEEKLKIFESYDIAGVGGWYRGLEKPEIWELLKKYVK